ncbi:MAG: hypothetical protein KIT18_06670, partial [Burkholderiales bacterium]|nr:hypothetical protein [Burkholderiales bacterium]
AFGQRAQQPLTREDIVWLVESVKTKYRAIAVRGAPDAAALLATLTPDNIRALERRLENDNRRFVRQHRLDGTPEERHREQKERTIRQIRDWAGSLTREQEERITTLSAEIPLLQHLRHEDRQRRQREFLRLIETRGEPGFERRLRDWLVHWDRGRAPEYERLQNEAYEKRIAMYLEVHRMLTPQQRTAVVRRLQRYADDFERLAQRGTDRVAESR